jgi:hypothetical protein
MLGDCEFFGKDKKMHKGEYLFTIDNAHRDKSLIDTNFSEHDPELKDGIKWLDGQAQEKEISFYDMVFEVLQKHDIAVKAKAWSDKQVKLN